MGKTKKQYQLFRYEIPPISNFQLVAESNDDFKFETIEELIEKKNKIFGWGVSEGLPSRIERYFDKSMKIVFYKDDLIVFNFGRKRKRTLNDEKFEEKMVDDWPYSTIMINNEPDVQLIAIEKNNEAFDSRRLLHIFASQMRAILEHFSLRLHIKPIFEKKDFWDIIKDHKDSIALIDFELNMPNMPNLRDGIMADLGKLQKITDSQIAKVQLKSDPEKNLRIEKSDPAIKSVIETILKSSSKFHLRLKGYHEHIKLGDQAVKQFELEELELSNQENVNKLKDRLRDEGN